MTFRQWVEQIDPVYGPIHAIPPEDSRFNDQKFGEKGARSNYVTNKPAKKPSRLFDADAIFKVKRPKATFRNFS